MNDSNITTDFTINLLKRLDFINDNLSKLKADVYDTINNLKKSNNIDEQKEKEFEIKINDISSNINSKITTIENQAKDNHKSHIENKKLLLDELNNQKEDNVKKLEEALKLLQKLETLEMKIGKK